VARWVTSKSSLLDFISLVVVYAPNEFPQEDYLSPEEQLTLTMAFDELRFGLESFLRSTCDPQVFTQLESLLERSLQHYEQGRDVEGAHVLQDFEAIAFP